MDGRIAEMRKEEGGLRRCTLVPNGCSVRIRAVEGR